MANAEHIAEALHLRPAGANRWRGGCPKCGGSSRFTLTEREGKTLWFCWGQCDRKALTAELRRRGLLPERERPPLTPEARRRRAWALRAGRDLARAAWRWRRERLAQCDSACEAAVNYESAVIDTATLNRAASEAHRLRRASAADVIQLYRRALEQDRGGTLALVAEGADWDHIAERWCKTILRALALHRKETANAAA